jgi:hypothetical protein
MDRTSQIAFILSRVKGLPQIEKEINDLAVALNKGEVSLKQLFETSGIKKQIVLDALEIFQNLYGQRPDSNSLNKWKIAELEGKIIWLDRKKRCLYYDPT